MKNFLIILLSVLLFQVMSAQQKDAKKIINDVINKFEKIKDYEVDIDVKLDMTGIKVPNMKAKLYFKQPDKIQVKSDGFAMLPKQSTNFSPSQFLQGDYTSVYVKTENIDGHNLDIVKIIPDSDSSDVVLSTLWIDVTDHVIRKFETTSKKSGTVTTELKYNKENQGLPSEIAFSFNAGNTELPQQLKGQNENDGNRRRSGQNISGSVIMKYSNYKINKGIPDSIFEEKKQD